MRTESAASVDAYRLRPWAALGIAAATICAYALVPLLFASFAHFMHERLYAAPLTWAADAAIACAWLAALAIIVLLLRLAGVPAQRIVGSFRASDAWFVPVAFVVGMAFITAARVAQRWIFHIHAQPNWTTAYFQFERAAPAQVLVFVGIGIFMGPLVEELLFRGVILGTRVSRIGFAPAAVVSALLFAASHRDPTNFAGHFAMGLVMAAVVRISGRIGPAYCTHGLINLVAFASLAAPFWRR